MARPTKCRKVCCMPAFEEFVPIKPGECIHPPCGTKYSSENQYKKNTVIMTVDEYETIRLIDHEGLSQEECCLRMAVARTTIQQIYNNARKKIADAMINGLCLKIEGGRYELCRGKNAFCNCRSCKKRNSDIR